MSFIPGPQEIYRHFKGGLYQVMTVAEHTETGERLVIYQALYGDFKIYARPLSLFTGKVDRAKYPDAVQELRFQLQGAGGGMRQGDTASWQGDAVAVHGNITPLQGDISAGQERAVPEAESVPGGEKHDAALDPFLLEFLDADSYEQRLNILAGLRHRITDEMITTMAVACDIEVGAGDLEERYAALKTCLLTLERYECNRLR